MTWEALRDPRDPNAWDVYEGERKVAHLPWCQKAEARLIAAAPDLLVALRHLLHVVDGTGMLLTGEASGLEHLILDGYGKEDRGLIENARAAIAQAEARP